jgi:hypothetical protein
VVLSSHLQNLVQQVGRLVEAVHERHLALLLEFGDAARQLTADLQRYRDPAVRTGSWAARHNPRADA